MQQYFVKGSAISPVTIEDKETSKHMFQVMRLKEDDEVTLVFDDGIKRLARVVNVEARQLELIEELADNVELPVQVTIASGFPCVYSNISEHKYLYPKIRYHKMLEIVKICDNI